jgi:hypothetical protein
VRLDEGESNIAEDAYPVARVDEVLRLLDAAKVVILGGDFYEVAADRPRPTGMNWYYDGSDAAASVQQARRAISQRWVDAKWHVTFVWR